MVVAVLGHGRGLLVWRGDLDVVVDLADGEHYRGVRLTDTHVAADGFTVGTARCPRCGAAGVLAVEHRPRMLACGCVRLWPLAPDVPVMTSWRPP
jgi:ribosomal protein S27AE